MIVYRGPVTNALKTFLETNTSKAIGVGRAPIDGEGNREDYPYVILWPLPGSRYMGPAWHIKEADAHLYYQIDSIGLTYEQAEWMADKVRYVMLDRLEDTAGFRFDLEINDDMTIMSRWMEEGSPGQNRPEGNIFRVVDTYCIAVTTS